MKKYSLTGLYCYCKVPNQPWIYFLTIYDTIVVSHIQNGMWLRKSVSGLCKVYAYIKKNYRSSNSLTVDYLKELQRINYKNSKSLYKKLFKWHVTIITNGSRYNTTDNYSSMSKYSTIYCHVSVYGGEPGKSLKLRYIGKLPKTTGTTKGSLGNFYDGSTGCCWFYYTRTPSGTAGNFVVKIYNGKKLMAKKTVRLY